MAEMKFEDALKKLEKIVSELEGGELSLDESLKRYEEGVDKLMSVMNAPITKLARTMSETYAQLVRVINAVAETKKAA